MKHESLRGVLVNGLLFLCNLNGSPVSRHGHAVLVTQQKPTAGHGKGKMATAGFGLASARPVLPSRPGAGCSMLTLPKIEEYGDHEVIIGFLLRVLRLFQNSSRTTAVLVIAASLHFVQFLLLLLLLLLLLQLYY